MEMPNFEFFQINEVAAILRVEPQIIARQIKRGRLRQHKIAGRYYVHKTDVHRWLAGLPVRGPEEALEEIAATINPSWTLVAPQTRQGVYA